MYTTIYKCRGHLYKVAKDMFFHLKSFSTQRCFFKNNLHRNRQVFYSQEALGDALSQDVLTSALHPSLHMRQLCMTEQTKQI